MQIFNIYFYEIEFLIFLYYIISIFIKFKLKLQHKLSIYIPVTFKIILPTCTSHIFIYLIYIEFYLHINHI